MLKKVSNWVVKVLLKGGLLSPEDYEIYLYGVETALLQSIHILTMLVVGFCLDAKLETLTFIVFYSIIRIYAGGFHATTKLCCYFISWIMISSAILIVKLLPISIMPTFSIGIYSLSLIIVFVLSPVGNKNKPLDLLEIHHYKTIVRKLLLAELFISVFVYFASVRIFCVISISLAFVALMLILGTVQNSKSHKPSVSITFFHNKPAD
ncbi:Accessory gene regulator protein B [Caprobacter fermentans]|uniref:Accessory gene regulator protein B n=1 Tax=Caproicibacter fermentans TaxID=2576756 RepID=A0A6N8HWF1_9FIRM|nr:accessory gene regulator B family protein [Caproicibacter fermentans]MVB10141.1 Accessory gene regulator protein B [Caproicibacter fermentans]